MKPVSLVITGHSLGAAMATLLAGLCPDADLVTFGSPRVGDGTFAASFAARQIRRYVDNTDIVARVPVRLPLLGYRHTDGLRHIDPTGGYRDLPEGENDGLFADLSALELFRLKNWDVAAHPRWLTDHAPINYVSAVRGVRGRPET